MTCEEIKISLHDYIDEQLDIITKNEVKNHLYSCDLCFKEYQRIQNFFELLKRLPYTLEPNEDIIKDFSKVMLEQNRRQEDLTISDSDRKKIEKEKKKQEAKLKANWSVIRKSRASKNIGGRIYSRKYFNSSSEWKKILFLLLVLLLLAAGYFIYDSQKNNSPWNYEIIAGNVLVNGSSSSDAKLKENDIISTEVNSRAIIFVPQTAKLELMPQSKIVLEKAKDGDNRIKINRGSLRVISSVDMPSLKVDYSAVDIIDRSGTFNIRIDSAQNAIVNVEAGFIEIDFGNEQYYAKEGYVCKIPKDAIPGIPYRVDAPDSIKSLAEQFNTSPDNNNIIEKLIGSTGKDDMLTLLAMIPRVTQLRRQILFQTIANHFPPPLNVTRLGILRADNDMLYEWWEDMEWQL